MGSDFQEDSTFPPKVDFGWSPSGPQTSCLSDVSHLTPQSWPEGLGVIGRGQLGSKED